MADKWDEARIQRMIHEQEPEGLNLEYKRAATLGKDIDKRDAITKAISAMANSAGGTIIFGVACFSEEGKKHLPERFDPIDIRTYSEEWLGQKISLVRPRIDGVMIIPVPLSGDPNRVIFIVQVPQGTTAHQATDHIYYKRFDSRSVPMEDYEIRDVMGRHEHPNIELRFEIIASSTVPPSELLSAIQDIGNQLASPQKRPFKERELKTEKKFTLRVSAVNTGNVYALYVHAFIYVPEAILAKNAISAVSKDKKLIQPNGITTYQYYADNAPDGSARYVPIFQSTSQVLENIELTSDFEEVNLQDLYIDWTVHADNAPPNNGLTKLMAIRIT